MYGRNFKKAMAFAEKYGAAAYRAPEEALHDPRVEGGYVIGIYPIRYTYELFGMPESVQAKGELYNCVDVDENVTMNYPGFSARHYVSFKKFKGGE